MSINFDIDVEHCNRLAFLKIESDTELFYRKIINIIDHSYKQYEGTIFKAVSECHIIVVELSLGHFKNNETGKIAKSIDEVSDENARNFIKDIFETEEEIQMFFKKLSRSISEK